MVGQGATAWECASEPLVLNACMPRRCLEHHASICPAGQPMTPSVRMSQVTVWGRTCCGHDDPRRQSGLQACVDRLLFLSSGQNTARLGPVRGKMLGAAAGE